MRLVVAEAERKQVHVVVQARLAPAVLAKLLENVAINNDLSSLYYPSMWFLPAAQKIVGRKTDVLYLL